MRHAGAREYLPQRIADVALVADHERAHLGVLGVSKVAIEELTDVGPYRFNLAGGKYRTMPDDLKQRRTERLFRRGHGGVDAVARHQPCVVELAWIAVVAREVDPRAQPYFVAELEIATAQHRDPHIAAARQHRCALFGGSIDSHVQPNAVGFVLGLAIHAAFDPNARAVDHRRDAMRQMRRFEDVRDRDIRCHRDCKVSDDEAERSSRCEKTAERDDGERRCEPQRNREVKVAERVAGDYRGCDGVNRSDAFERAEGRQRRQDLARPDRLQTDRS